ncbi:uncharacterized protein APUU_80595A [Aspergillus puulaauensis]|uniref:Uncharacterized protein n=1 Tax=Aspergillus puulaauensis TaxID=1220207 RepID=A0A7R7XYX6_9EURO|nr:uncharacterized protein APUU_80595A [Aspergillus puulaauensis]BCS30292.1 hypothetical protein APUU_80595A [Aspergillus puulaauensis]
MSSPTIASTPRSHPRVITPTTYSQKDIFTALMASTTQSPKSLDVTDTASNDAQSPSAFEYPPPPPPSPVESKSPRAF